MKLVEARADAAKKQLEVQNYPAAQEAKAKKGVGELARRVHLNGGKSPLMIRSDRRWPKS